MAYFCARMNYLIFIFAFYFASLTAMPCQDLLASQETCGAEESEHAAADQHSEEGAEERCSPFCSCHCCQIHSVVEDSGIENAFLPLARENKNRLIPGIFSKELFSIWHPPRA